MNATIVAFKGLQKVTDDSKGGRAPDELLRQIQSEEDCVLRGRLKIFLGYASGVGKSFRMFDEGRRRKERGEDVVVAAMQPNPSDDVAEIARGLEVVPLLNQGGRSMMDVPALTAEFRLRPADL